MGAAHRTRATREQERSTTWLRNRGVGREMLRLIQSKGAPVRRIFKQLAELGVPCSMTEELTRCKLADWDKATERQQAALQSLWQLAETYTDVANRLPGALEGLDEIVLEAQALGVYYDPPACAEDLIAKRARKSRVRYVEAEPISARPGRTLQQDQLLAIVHRALTGRNPPLTPEVQLVVDLRLQGYTAVDICGHVRHSEGWVREVLKRPEVVAALTAVKPLSVLEAEARQRMLELRSRTNRRVATNDDWLLARKADGWTLQQMAAALKTSRQAVAYRLGRAQARASEAPTPLEWGGEPGGLPSPNFRDGAPCKQRSR
jgi:hypothetical protein